MKNLAHILAMIFGLFSAVHPASAMLMVNELVGFHVGGAERNCSYVTAVTSSANSTAYTFSAASIGTAASDRFVIVGVLGRAAGARTISSSTIGGAATTELLDTSGQNYSGFIGLTVTSGTTADIVVTMSGSMNQMTIVIFKCTGLTSTTPEDTDYNSAADPTFLMNVSAGSYTIAAAMEDSATATTTWTGPTEVYDAINESSMTAAIIQQATANASFTVTATFSAGTSGSMTGISMK